MNFSDILGRRFDGAIVTGAPIEQMAFEEVKYWEELVGIMSYLRSHCTSTMYLCWGAMAGLYYFHNIPKTALGSKLFGVFDHRVVEADLLLNGLDDVVKMPHSRYSGIDEALVRQKQELKILLEGQESGISVLKDSQDVFVLGHLEYAHNTLQEEYERDLAKGLPISAPKHYYDASGAPVCSWRSSASVFFANWLNFSVYQVTPFVL